MANKAAIIVLSDTQDYKRIHGAARPEPFS